jgi:hypothetical protein
MTEPRNDARNDFSIAMLADQDMGARSPIADRDHELLGVPKSQNDMAPVPVECIDRLMTAGLTAHQSDDATNDSSPYRRQQRELDPVH